MIYKSTRGSGEAKSSTQAIIKGIADDNGLYVPEIIPEPGFDFKDLSGLNYRQVAALILPMFLTDYTVSELDYCISNAYDDKFSSGEVVPIVKAGNAWFMELYHGKTAAFKDMALSILPYLLTIAIKKERVDKTIAILTATSGDTGKAALEGFSDVPGTEIIVFYPYGGVSAIQERQMTTQQGANTHVFGIKGNFDDAQTAVKRIFGSKEIAKILEDSGYLLSSANSINIGRLIPQVVYYIYAYAKLVEQGTIDNGDYVNIAVPTGNFGNILAAYYAYRMGLPVRKFICASNRNRILTDFINTGVYDIQREFFVTNSPSMDILISSNLERLLYHLSGEDGKEVSRLMAALEINKRYVVKDTIKKNLCNFYGGYALEEETLETIGNVYRKYGYLLDTHTAVAYKVYSDYRNQSKDDTPVLIAATASAYKFAESTVKAIGLQSMGDGFKCIELLEKSTGIQLPRGLAGLENRRVIHKKVIDKDKLFAAVKEALRIENSANSEGSAY